MDVRWANDMLGFNNKLPFNMYNFGCYVTAWAMVCRYYGKDIDPGQLNTKLKDLGAGKGFKGGDYVPGGVHLLYGDIKETRTATPSALTDTQLGEIRTAIDNGYPVICGIDVNPRTVAYDSHFVCLVDYNPNDENDFMIADPLGGKTRSLKDYLGWLIPGIRQTMYSYVITSGPKPKHGGEMIPILKEHYELYLKNHDQWHKLVHYLKPEADPNTTLFEDIQTVIAGIKSRQTDLENQLNTALKQITAGEVEIKNQKDKLANKEAECQRTLKTQKAEYEAQISAMPDVKKLEGQYKGTITELEGKLKEAQKAGGVKDLTISRISNELEYCEKGLEKYNAFQKFGLWLIDQIKKIRSNKKNG